MAYSIDDKLVVGISANALFHLKYENEIFIKEGLEAYRNYQVKNKDKILPTGVAFPFIKRLLKINEIHNSEKPIEVVFLSKNSPETGIRIFNSTKYYSLDITRAVYTLNNWGVTVDEMFLLGGIEKRKFLEIK